MDAGATLRKPSHPGTAAGAGLLSAFIPGAGHCYVGQQRRFLSALAVLAALVVCLAASGLLSSPAGFIAMIAAEAGVYLFGVADSFVLGLRRGRGESSRLYRIGVTLLWTVVVVALTMTWVAIREPLLGYAVYRISSPTMKPTLEVGDTILVDTKRPAESQLTPGVITVVRNAANDRLYVRRLQERTDANTYALGHDWTWAPRGPEPETVAREDIVGIVTAVLWSPQRQRLGFIPA